MVVFQLPESPAPKAACFYARTDQAEPLGEKHLAELPDRELPGEGNAAMFEAIETFGAATDVRHELFADADYRGTHSFWCGFRLDATPAQLSRALTKDGFFALELKAPIYEVLRQLSPAEITRRLALCSVDLSLEACRQGTSLPHHAQAIGDTVGYRFAPLGGGAADDETVRPFVAALLAESRQWTESMSENFLLAVGTTASWRARKQMGAAAEARPFVERVRGLLEALPAPRSREVQSALATLGFRPGKSRTAKPRALPSELPRSLPEALRLLSTLAASPRDLCLGAPATAPAGAPPSLRAFYALHGRMGERTILPPAKLRALRGELAAWIADDPDQEPEVAAGEVHVTRLSTPRQLVPFGKDDGGDFYFLDPAFGPKDQAPVFRYVHDESMTCRVEASCVASFVAGQGLRLLGELSRLSSAPLDDEALEALIRKDRARIRVPKALARGARPSSSRKAARARPRTR